MVKAVIFDLDDTLVSEEEYVISGYRHVSKLISVETGIDSNGIFDDLMRLYKESPQQVFNRYFEMKAIQKTEKKIQSLVGEYRSHLPEINFFPDVIPVITKLKELNKKIGIITDGYLVAQKQKIKVLGADRYFDEIIYTDDLGREFWKPHPKSFELMRERLGVSFEEMVYVGDNPEKDFYISKNLPITTIRVLREDEGLYMNRQYLGGIKERIRIGSLLDLLEHV